ncbi:MAG: stage III sporulation protein AE [Inconstantimicrobium porci]|uniref:stage III sporulation protein AE n=1 Tax=Inconstantimicrobium porci TaxID=2652291 RepID=UPI002A914944|nr:stage III sporulation protein AE [Inconstantimicrobium porci]MDY5913275.1 stage III sporulation protein AE [Inconstantimicrobium porci]
MKKVVLFIVTILIFFICSFSYACCEEKKNDTDDLLNNITIENFYKQIEEDSSEQSILKSLNPREFINKYSKDGKSSISASTIIDLISKNLFKELYVCVKIMISIIVIAIISALLKNIEDSFTGSSIANIAFYSCYVLIILLLTKNFVSSVNIAKSAIKDITDFMSAIMPVLILLITTAGGISQAATLDPIVAAAVTITPRIYMDIILPLILMSFVLCFVNNISTEHKVEQLAKFIKQITLWLQGIILTVFVGLITIRSMTASTFDAVTLKTAKFAVDNFIPIVGKAISDSISTVAGYALLLKNAFGVLGLIIILSMLLFPVIKIISIVIVYKISAAIIEPIVDKRIVNCISSASDSLVLVSSMLFCVTLIFFILLCIMANTGKLIIGG